MVSLSLRPQRRPAAMRHQRICAALISLIVLAAVVSTAHAAPLPRLPTERAGHQALAVRPPVVDFTGDGSGFLGGITSRRAIPKSKLRTLREFGRLRWTSWNDHDARAVGAIWLDNGIPDEANGTFYPYRVEVRAFRPVSGIFTRLAFVYWTGDWPYATVLHARRFPPDRYGPGYWQWF